MNDLTLTHLTYAGSSLPDAQVAFSPTFTLVCGDSNTGKSFIVDSIDYMLGGHTTPAIPHAEGYSQILLGLLLPDGSPLTLVRAPGSNNVHVHEADLRGLVHAAPDAVLSVRRTKNRRDVSHYVLDRLGLADAYIRTNEAGNTEHLRLADLTHLAIVTDGRMVDQTPPSQRVRGNAAKTAARSVMKLVLTGEDEPPASKVPNAAQRRIQKGKIALLDQLVIDLSAKQTTEENGDQLRARQARLAITLETVTASLREATERQSRIAAERTQHTEAEEGLAVRLGEVRDLLGRFDILRQQYESDLARLEMVGEAGNLLGYFRAGRCVFCGAEPERQEPAHDNHETTHLHEAVTAESAKTRALLADLRLTIADLEEQRDDLLRRQERMHIRGTELDRTIRMIEEQLLPAKGELDQVLTERSEIERNLEVLARIGELDEHRAELVAAGAVAAKRADSLIPGRTVRVFDSALQRILERWNVPGTEHAGYDPYGGDVRAGGQARADHGRGMQALLRSAFSAALAEYCIDRRLPHLGFLVLDSPLVTYGQLRDEDEARLAPEVNDSFYRHFLHSPGQTIIVENTPPPPDVVEQAHVVMFRRTGDGRHGFFPTRPGLS
ncbi:hypothetical protein ACFV84_09765 [Kitasatospora sp. NPDC059811]|uniref:hypothetical protein n=1 Tax=Streptomycetaceae TaxID=2062 RepID=UPI0007AFE174|nr:hypothetical protein [Streptomyces sp. MJM8645]